MLYIHTSNQLENLVQALADTVVQPLAHPLNAEIITIQHLSVKHWLSLQLAEKLGIWANCQFPFLHNLLRKVFKAALNVQITDPFTQEIMEWTLMKVLPNYLNNQEFASIKAYLQDDTQGLKRFQLANRIANLFDNYMVFRSEEMRIWQTEQQPPDWQNNTTAAWQKILWQALQNQYNVPNRVELQYRLLQKFQNNAYFDQLKQSLHKEGIQRISVFGISALSSFYLSVLDTLGRIIDVHIFLLNPSQEYWADIISETQQARKMRYANHVKIPFELLHFDIGNNLLASMGKFGRDFIELLHSFSENSQTVEIFTDPGRKNLLHCIQQDILILRQQPANQPKQLIDKNDDSIQIHVCHSHMREIEVLYDQLLALFEKNPLLQPKDIIVAMPDVEVYAPLIEAIFATVPEEQKRIPFTIADCSLRHQNILINAFLAILELKNSRFTSNDVMKILEFEAIQHRFDLTIADLQLIRHWIHQTGIRWGMDKNSHPDLQSADFEQNTWQHGLNRLLLGYALPRIPLHHQTRSSHLEEQLFADILSFDQIEGKDTLILGKLIGFVKRLFAMIQQLAENHTLVMWRQLLIEIVENFLQADHETEEQLEKIYIVLNKLVEYQQLSGLTEKVSSEVIFNYLQRYLEKEPQNSPFLTGQVTFCNIHSINAIPFKIIYLLGMNDQIFPRIHKPLTFDLIAQNPRPSDRSPRENDRYTFLTSLLAARDYFYISYVGHDIHDNSEIMPSVLINELIDYIDKSFLHASQIVEKIPESSEKNKKASDHLIIVHPLQPFSYRYFSHHGDNQLISYASDYYQAHITPKNQRVYTFLETSLPAPEPKLEWQTIELERLIRFFINPTEFFLRHRLGIILPSQEDFLEDNEPFILTGLEKYQLTQEMVERGLNGQDLQKYYTIIKASGQLPYGDIGKQKYQQYQEQVQQFIDQLQQQIDLNMRLESLPFRISLGEMTLVGHLHPLYQRGLVHYRYARLKPKDHLRAWLYHLILNIILPENTLPHSLLMGYSDELLVTKGKNSSYVACNYRPVADSMAILEKLLQLYWQGLQQPLPFFPKTAFTFANERQQKGKSSEEALHHALKVWQGDENSNKNYSHGEKEGVYYQLCFGQLDDNILLNNTFQTIAMNIFAPLLRAIQSIEIG